MSDFKVYIIVHVKESFIYVFSKRIYRNLAHAKNRLKQLKETYEIEDLKIMVADNWKLTEVEDKK